MKSIVITLAVLFSSVSWAGASKDLYTLLDGISLVTPVGASDGQSSLQFLTCKFVTLSTGKDYACWYQVPTASGGQPADAQLIPDHVKGQSIYAALRSLGFSERLSPSEGEIFVRSLVCKKTTSSLGIANYVCTGN